ncbi:protein dopey-2-like [Rhincodon typus]|uniref:protein dopey-2-like n=1 Tax=Rhincodon typus TaxID=259920 RepID=UPI00202DEF9A|nr:protein dopey-2-like [Rhincodon typus]
MQVPVCAPLQKPLRELGLDLHGSHQPVHGGSLTVAGFAALLQLLGNEGNCVPDGYLLLLFLCVHVDEAPDWGPHKVLSCLGLSWCLVSDAPPHARDLGPSFLALQSNLKYSLLPKRLIISKRLAQCLHPALPIGVHLKALETYEVIFKIIGTKWLAKDLFFYSSGLFPLLGNAAMSVKPVLLGLYEKYYLPLHKSLNPSLQAFITGLLPGLEEGSEIYERTDVLLQKLILVVGQEVFYGALWGSVIVSPSIRLPASLFVVNHINRSVFRREQKYMFGTDPRLAVKALCASVQDSNVLVQRNTLEILFYFFPLCSYLDPNNCVVPMTRGDMVLVLSAALHTVLRRDMSLNRRLYAWLLGTDIKGGHMTADADFSSEGCAKTYFEKHSKDLLVRALIRTLQQVNPEPDQEHGPQAHQKPFRILISLLDKPELGFGNVFCRSKDIQFTFPWLHFGTSSNDKNGNYRPKTVNQMGQLHVENYELELGQPAQM